jgi:FtsZ-interacting cell division protein ZipA
MKELQISLLLIGIVAMLVVYGYNWLQQRKYRQKFGAAFEQQHEDALHHPAPNQPYVQEAEEGELAAVAGEAPAPVEPPRGLAADGICALLDEATDYVAVLTFNTPEGADDLALLWQKRFDFGKSVHVCGLNATIGAWEKVIAESRLFYAAFKLTLQLTDRAGPVSEVRLSDFCDTVRDIAANMGAAAQLPDVAAACGRAAELDAFCASVDQMVGLNILPSGERVFSGNEVARVAEQHGLSLQADGAFHLPDEGGHTLFSLCNFEDAPFHHHNLGQMWVKGLTLLLDVPRVERPAERFDEMAVLARQLAMELRAGVVDDRRVALGEAGFAQIREQIAEIEGRMLEGQITPGSAQARRLFS